VKDKSTPMKCEHHKKARMSAIGSLDLNSYHSMRTPPLISIERNHRNWPSYENRSASLDWCHRRFDRCDTCVLNKSKATSNETRWPRDTHEANSPCIWVSFPSSDRVGVLTASTLNVRVSHLSNVT
jgi:hypothetical protein